MALAPLEGQPRDPQAARGPLRLVQGGRPASAPPRRSAVHARPEALARSRASHPTAVGSAPWSELDLAGNREACAPRPVALRRVSAVRAQTLARRRRTVGVVVVLVAAVLLAMPIRALGAVTVAGQSTPGAVPSGLAPGSVYVVQPGDSIHSIAERINPAERSTIERELATSLGSSTVVPGERVLIP
jgi:hypothetical protein